MLVGELQKKHPGTTLRVMAVEANIRPRDCSKGASNGCFHGIATNLGRLFANSPFATHVQVGKFTTLAVSPQIFGEVLTPRMGECGGKLAGTDLTYMAGEFTTVENKHFGVTPGTKVQLLALNLNSPLDDIPELSSIDQYGSLAEAAYEATAALAAKCLGDAHCGCA